MKRIDFLGVPGIGKSTVYNHLVKVRASQKDYLFSMEARHQARTRVIARKNKTAGLIISSLVGLETFRKMFSHSVYLTGDQTRAAVEQCNREYKDYLETCAAAVARKSSDPVHMLLGCHWLTGKIEEFIFLNNNLTGDSRVVFDESLSQKVFGLTDLFTTNDTFIKDYFTTVPLPAAVVSLTGEPPLVLGRLEKKARGNIAHRHLKSEELASWVALACQLVEEAKTIYLKRGVKVLTVPAGAEPEENARLINDYLTCL